MQCQKQIKIPEHYENTFGESGKATKNQNQKPKKEILMRYTSNLQLEFNEPLTLFSQPQLSPHPPPVTLTVFANIKKNCSDKTNVPRSVGVEGGTEGNLKLSATFKTSFHRVHKSPSQSWHLFLSLIRNPPPPPQFSSSLLLHCLISSSL